MDKTGVAVGLATIGVVGAAVLFAVEHVHTGPKNFIESHLVFCQTVMTVQWKFWSL